MNTPAWFSENKLAASLGLSFVALAAALAYLAIGAWDDYENSMSEFQRKSDQLKSLSNQAPPPLQSTREALEKSVKNSEADLQALFARLGKYRVPVFGNISKAKPQDQPQEFQDVLRKEVTRMKSIAAETQSRIPQNFYLGLESFENRPPGVDEVTVLSRKLTVLDWIAESILSHKDVTLEEFLLAQDPPTLKKDPAGNKNTPKGIPGPEKSSSPFETVADVRLKFRCSQSTFRKFVNSLLDAPSFLLIDTLQVQNSSMEPPRRDAPPQSSPLADGSTPIEKLPVIVGRETLAVSMKIKALEFKDEKAGSTAAPPSQLTVP